MPVRLRRPRGDRRVGRAPRHRRPARREAARPPARLADRADERAGGRRGAARGGRRDRRRGRRGPPHRGPRRRPRDADLHLGHHRASQGLRDQPPQPALRGARGRRHLRPDDAGRQPDPAVPAAGPHLRPRHPVRGDGVPLRHRALRRHPEPARPSCPASSPTSCSRCPGCSRRSTTAPRRRPTTAARAGSSTSPRTRPSTTAAPWTAAAPAWSCAPSTPLFDRLVFSKLRAALGGQCRGAVSGGSALGERIGHFFRGVGVPIHEGYGLTETSAAITANGDRAIKVGTVGRPIPGVTVRDRRRRRGPGARRGRVPRLLEQPSGPRRRSPTAGSTPATSAASTRTATCRSPGARRS